MNSRKLGFKTVDVSWHEQRFSPSGHLAISGNIFACHNVENATVIQWIEARDAVKHPLVESTAPTTWNYLVENSYSAKVEKP